MTDVQRLAADVAATNALADALMPYVICAAAVFLLAFILNAARP